MKPRIYIGIHEIVGYIETMTDGLRANGYTVTSAHTQHAEVKRKSPFDHTIRYHNWIQLQLKLFIEMLRVMFTHDIFIFNACEGFLSTGMLDMKAQHPRIFWLYKHFWDWALLHMMGKKIVVICHGCDIRLRPEMIYHGMNKGLYFVFCTECVRPHCDRTGKLARIKAIEKYADHIFAYDDNGFVFKRKHHELVFPINLSKLEYKTHDRERPIILHACYRPDVKGTIYVHRALAELAREGYKFHTETFHNIDHNELMRKLTNSDMVIVHVAGMSVGVLGLEGMATGNVVFTGNLEHTFPGLHVTPDTLATILKREIKAYNLFMDHPRMEMGRMYVEQHHDHVKVAREFMEAIKCQK